METPVKTGAELKEGSAGVVTKLDVGLGVIGAVFAGPAKKPRYGPEV